MATSWRCIARPWPARYDAEQVAETVRALRGPGNARQRIAAFLTQPIAVAYEGADARGCFLCNAAADRAAEDPEAASLVRAGFDHMERALAQTALELAPTVTQPDAAAIVAECLATYTGLRVMARSALRRDFLETARDRVLAKLPS